MCFFFFKPCTGSGTSPEAYLKKINREEKLIDFFIIIIFIIIFLIRQPIKLGQSLLKGKFTAFFYHVISELSPLLL